MRGVSKEPFAYVSEFEKGLPKEDQTVFWLVQQNVRSSVQALARYSKGVSTNPITRKDDVDELAWLGADKENFITAVHHVENYIFDGTNDPINIKPEDIELKEKLFYDLSPTVIKELMDKAKEPRITVADKKKSK